MIVEKMVKEPINMDSLLKHFSLYSNAPHAISKLRDLFLTLSLRGRFDTNDLNDIPAKVVIAKCKAELANEIEEKRFSKRPELKPIENLDISFTVPKNWEWVRFGELMDIQGGSQPPKSYFIDEPAEGYVQLIQIRDLGPKPRPVYVPIEKVTKLCKKEDILIGRYGASVGKVFWGKDGAYNVALIKILFLKDYILPEFLYLFFKSKLFQEKILGITRSAQSGFNKGDVHPILVPFPPLEEQKRIVNKVDELMSLCDKLEAQQQEQANIALRANTSALDALINSDATENSFEQNWKRIAEHFNTLYGCTLPMPPGDGRKKYLVGLENLKSLRKIILHLAVSGKLVPQRMDEGSAAIFLERVKQVKNQFISDGIIKEVKFSQKINEEDTPFGLPQNWAWGHIWDIAKIITSGSRAWAKYYSESGAKFMTMGNLSKDDYKLRLEKIKYVTVPEKGEGSRTKLEKNDLLISITGDVGNLGLIPSNFGDAYINQHTCLLRFMPMSQSRYFVEFMRSPCAINQFNAPQRGIKNSFRLGDVGEMLVPIPPLEEQNRIVKKIDQLMALCDKLEQQLIQSYTDAEKLMEATMNALVA